MNLQENIRTLLKEEYGRKYILYRGVGLDEAIKSCETGHLVYYSRDPMSRDWEVIEYGLGSEASEMSEEEVEEYVNNLVSWKRKSKGVNLTSDLDNAKGYSDIVLEINLVGYDYAEFSDVHIFAKNPDDCKIKSVYYNGEEYSKEEFLNITKSLQESIRRILREETEFTSKFRRRLNGFVEYVWNNYATQYPCDVETFEDFMNVLYGEIEMVIDEGDGEDGPVSNWLTYDEGVKYINDYMIDDLREFYNKQCGE
jgi:hypothetical protein